MDLTLYWQSQRISPWFEPKQTIWIGAHTRVFTRGVRADAPPPPRVPWEDSENDRGRERSIRCRGRSPALPAGRRWPRPGLAVTPIDTGISVIKGPRVQALGLPAASLSAETLPRALALAVLDAKATINSHSAIFTRHRLACRVARLDSPGPPSARTAPLGRFRSWYRAELPSRAFSREASSLACAYPVSALTAALEVTLPFRGLRARSASQARCPPETQGLRPGAGVTASR